MPKERQPKKIMNRKEAAKYLGFSDGTLAVWASTRTRIIKSFKIGRSVRYRLEDLDEFMDQYLIP